MRLVNDGDVCVSGTASVAAAGIFASLRITKKKLSENVFVMQGAGEVRHGRQLEWEWSCLDWHDEKGRQLEWEWSCLDWHDEKGRQLDWEWFCLDWRDRKGRQLEWEWSCLDWHDGKATTTMPSNNWLICWIFAHSWYSHVFIKQILLMAFVWGEIVDYQLWTFLLLLLFV